MRFPRTPSSPRTPRFRPRPSLLRQREHDDHLACPSRIYIDTSLGPLSVHRLTHSGRQPNRARRGPVCRASSIVPFIDGRRGKRGLANLPSLDGSGGNYFVHYLWKYRGKNCRESFRNGERVFGVPTFSPIAVRETAIQSRCKANTGTKWATEWGVASWLYLASHLVSRRSCNVFCRRNISAEMHGARPS